jgi:hypothetical protein
VAPRSSSSSSSIFLLVSFTEQYYSLEITIYQLKKVQEKEKYEKN